ncbi:MAG: glucosamine inositolphosphorylceramide transferase family protein [Aquihabitans sp.]
MTPGRQLVDRGLAWLRTRQPGCVDESWWVAVAPPGAADALDPRACTRLRNRRGTFLADPVPLVGRTDEYLVEEFRFRDRRGIISHLRFDEAGRASLRSGVIEAPFHLSFPTSFRYDGRTWVVPEAAASGATHLWEIDVDAGSSRHAGTIIDVPVRDVVIFEHDGRWYLLGTGAEPCWHLVLYSSDNPLSGWTPVPLDNRTDYVRPGGSLVRTIDLRDGGGDTMVAPMQGSSRGYGSELALCELQLAPMAVLTPGQRLDPPQPFIGLHTLAMGESQNLVDLKHLRFRSDRMLQRLRPARVLRRVLGRSVRATEPTIDLTAALAPLPPVDGSGADLTLAERELTGGRF